MSREIRDVVTDAIPELVRALNAVDVKVVERNLTAILLTDVKRLNELPRRPWWKRIFWRDL